MPRLTLILAAAPQENYKIKLSKTILGPMWSVPKKENLISLAVNEILSFRKNENLLLYIKEDMGNVIWVPIYIVVTFSGYWYAKVVTWI